MATRDTALASDAFTRGDGGLGTDWTTISGLEAPAIVSNRVRDSSNADGTTAGALYTPVSSPNDQWSEVRVHAAVTATTRWVGAYARSLTASHDGYRARVLGPLGVGTARLDLDRIDAGVVTQLATATGLTIAADDFVGIECEGTTIRAFHNSTEIHSVSDATFASGGWGIAVRVNTSLALSGAEADDWSAGTFVSTRRQTLMLLGLGA